MRNTSIFFAPLLFASLSLTLSAQSPVEKTFTKAFNAEGKSIVRLELPGTVDIKIWDNPSIRFEIGVGLPAGNGPMLNELANIGRYNLVSKSEADILVVNAPNLQKQLKVKGQEIKETLSFIVFVPKNLEIQLLPPGSPELAAAKK